MKLMFRTEILIICRRFIFLLQSEAKRKNMASMTISLCYLICKLACDGDEEIMQQKFPELKSRMNGLPAGEKTFG